MFGIGFPELLLILALGLIVLGLFLWTGWSGRASFTFISSA